MKTRHILSIPLFALALASCGAETGRNDVQPNPDTTEASRENSGQIFSATGEVTETSIDSVTIAHGPVEEIGWPAMTMAFEVQFLEMVRDTAVGDRVRFEFRETDTGYVLTSIETIEP